MADRSGPYLLRAGATRVEGAILPFPLTAADSAGGISICHFTLPPRSSGPVLHSHDAVDEGHYVLAGELEVRLGDQRLTAHEGDFAWVPRGTAHTFANGSDEPARALSFAVPGGIEHLFAEQWSYLESLDGPPDPEVMAEIGLRHGAPTLGPPLTPGG